MHKHFFKIKNDIYIKDILKILEISNSFFLDSNKTLDALILNTKVIDFVSFNNLKHKGVHVYMKTIMLLLWKGLLSKIL